MIRSTVFALLLTLSASAATFPVTTAPLGDPPGERSVPELAAGRDGYLAAWIDQRSGRSVLLCARIAADGAVLDPTGIALGPSAGPAKVLWTGERYLVFYRHRLDLVMRSVAEDGTVGAMQKVVPNALLDYAEPIDVATNGQRIVVVYAGDTPQWDIRARIHAAVLTMEGTLIEDVLIEDNRQDRLTPSVATNGSVFAVAWNRMRVTPDQSLEGFEVRAVRLDARGVRLDAQPRIVGDDGIGAALRANGSSFLIDHRWRSRFVSADLKQIGAPVERPVGRLFTLDGHAAIVNEDYATFIGPDTPRWIHVVKYDAQGNPGSGTRVVTATENHSTEIGGASAVQRGNDVLVAWLTSYSTTGSSFRLFTTLASASSLDLVSEPRILTSSATPQRFPSIATGENDALVAWSQPDGIYAARVTADGRRLDGAGIKLSESALTHQPVAVYDSGRYAIAFGQFVNHDEWEVVVRFISSEGLSQEVIRIPVAEYHGQVAMASGGGSLVLAWTDGGMRATRIHAGGTFDPPVTVQADAEPVDPVISFNGAHFLVAWTDTRLDYDWILDLGISGRRLTPELQFADAESRPLASFGIWRDHDAPSLASNGSDWFLTWSEYPPAAGPTKEIRITRISADGTSESQTGTILTRGFGAELVWTGNRLMMAWKDDVNGNPLYVAPVDDLAARQTLDPSTLIYEEGRQVSLTRRGSGWAATYSVVGGADTGHVPRALVTLDGRTKGKARAIR